MKPPLLSGAEVRKALERGGFRFIDQRGSHAKMRHDGRQATAIVVMDREMDRWTLKTMLRNAGISIEEFMSWVESR